MTGCSCGDCELCSATNTLHQCIKCGQTYTLPVYPAKQMYHCLSCGGDLLVYPGEQGGRLRFLNHLAGVSEDKPHRRSYATRSWDILPLRGRLGSTPTMGINASLEEVLAWASQSNRPNRA